MGFVELFNECFPMGRLKVQISHCVADALEAIDQKPFVANVMDFNLADGSGLEVAEWIRSKGSEVPIILISGCNSDCVASRAEKIRMFDFLEKPFSGDTICNAVKKAIGYENLTTDGKSSTVPRQ